MTEVSLSLVTEVSLSLVTEVSLHRVTEVSRRIRAHDSVSHARAAAPPLTGRRVMFLTLVCDAPDCAGRVHARAAALPGLRWRVPAAGVYMYVCM